MAHNFSHSFLSPENYGDDDYVIEDLKAAIRDEPAGIVSICWIPLNASTYEKFTERVRKSIAHYREWLPEHAARQGVDLAHIKELRTDLVRKPSHQLQARTYVLDDRGKEYDCKVMFW